MIEFKLGLFVDNEDIRVMKEELDKMMIEYTENDLMYGVSYSYLYNILDIERNSRNLQRKIYFSRNELINSAKEYYHRNIDKLLMRGDLSVKDDNKVSKDKLLSLFDPELDGYISDDINDDKNIEIVMLDIHELEKDELKLKKKLVPDILWLELARELYHGLEFNSDGAASINVKQDGVIKDFYVGNYQTQGHLLKYDRDIVDYAKVADIDYLEMLNLETNVLTTAYNSNKQGIAEEFDKYNFDLRDDDNYDHYILRNADPIGLDAMFNNGVLIQKEHFIDYDNQVVMSNIDEIDAERIHFNKKLYEYMSNDHNKTLIILTCIK